MYYHFTLNIPSGTTIAAPASLDVKLTHGIITKVNIFFVPDCAGYVGVRIKRFEHVAWPSNTDTWFIRNEGDIPWAEHFDLTVAPHTLTVEGYNEDDSYAHDVQFSFEVEARENVLSELFRVFTRRPTKVKEML